MKRPVKALQVFKDGPISDDFADFLFKTLDWDPARRAQNAGELLEHPWFAGFTEDDFLQAKVKAPFLPDTTVANCDATDLNMNAAFENKNDLPKPKPEEQEQFEDYQFNKETDQRK